MKPRVLHVITVYNGRVFVPRAIESAMRMDRSEATIDVLVLDDASPEPGWSEELGRFCKLLGAHYYRTPRNLGIPRNVSLGLATAMRKNYDYVTINNSDVVFPKNLIGVMIEACRGDKVGSVTAWSNNVSIYSIPNEDPDKYLANQDIVDFLSDRLQAKYGNEVIDGPAGISFCIMMPVDVVRQVGLMDPIFGRGYCEETDWSLRSSKLGYRVCVSLGTFVYHQGRGSNLAAGLVSGAHSTVPENEVIIDMRFPDFRKQCEEFEKTGVMARYKGEVVDYIIDQAARVFGYRIVPGWQQERLENEPRGMRVEILPEKSFPIMRYTYAGFAQEWPLEGLFSIANAIRRFGGERLHFNAFEHAISTNNDSALPYPSTVW